MIYSVESKYFGLIAEKPIGAGLQPKYCSQNLLALIGGDIGGGLKQCTGNSVKFGIIKKRIDMVYEKEQYLFKRCCNKRYYN